MFKAMILLKRNQGDSFQQFRDWWIHDHAPLARQLPGLQNAVFNLDTNGGNGEYDGVSELWFTDQQAFEAAYASDIGKRVAADSMAHVSKRERLLVSEFPLFESQAD